MLNHKFDLTWISLLKVYEGVDFISIICFKVMPILMLINDILCVCMLLIYCLCFINTMFMREGDQVKR
jgi:hypothetical protein